MPPTIYLLSKPLCGGSPLNPLFDSDGAEALGSYLRERLAQGDGRPVLRRVENSPYRPSRKLMDYVAATISEQSPWILLDEQLVIFEKIRSTVCTRDCLAAVRKS
jgi:hypothetical protein